MSIVEGIAEEIAGQEEQVVIQKEPVSGDGHEFVSAVRKFLLRLIDKIYIVSSQCNPFQPPRYPGFEVTQRDNKFVIVVMVYCLVL